MKCNRNQITEIKVYKQSGAALLIGMVVLASVVAFYMIGQHGAKSDKHDRQDSRIEVLSKAKKALIAYAVSYIETHPGEYGFLPCPDETSGGLPEGEQESFCSGNKNESVIGRLPWRTLDLPVLKDDSNECLWYAVSGPYKHTNTVNGKADMLNEDSNGLFQVYDSAGNPVHGANPNNRVVAMVFAPSNIVNAQDRTPAGGTAQCGGHYAEADYLEGNGVYDNSVLNNAADIVDQFIKAGTNSEDANPAFNDRLITITRDEIWNAVKKRRDFNDSIQNLTLQIASCLKGYGDAGTERNLPWPAPVDFAGDDYREDVNYTDTVFGAGSVIGRLPNQVDESELQLGTNTGNNGNGNNGNGNNGNGNNGNGNGNNGGGGNTQCETDCQTTYDDAVAVAAQIYNNSRVQAFIQFFICRIQGGRANVCAAQRRQDIADAQGILDASESAAQTTLDQCIAACSGGGGGGGSVAKGEGYVLFDINDPDNAGNPLNCLVGEDLKLWQHWKDHFFYAVSEDFSPTSTNVTCTGNCLTTIAGQHAAIIMYSGSRSAAQDRTGPVVIGDPIVADDPDDKSVISNYLSTENSDLDTVYDVNDDDYLICIDEGANPGDPLVITNPCN